MIRAASAMTLVVMQKTASIIGLDLVRVNSEDLRSTSGCAKVLPLKSLWGEGEPRCRAASLGGRGRNSEYQSGGSCGEV